MTDPDQPQPSPNPGAAQRWSGRRGQRTGIRRRLAAVVLLPALGGLGGCAVPPDIAHLWLAGTTALELIGHGGCLRGSQLHGNLTPLELYRAMESCMQRSDVNSAVILFSLAGAYGHYDARRVVDPSAQQAGTLLRTLALQRLSEPQRQALVAAIRSTADDPERLPQLCATLERIGPPTYHPAYMLRHGLGAGQEGAASPRRDLVEGFQGAEVWEQVLDSFLRCSKA
jgi:hypothetical protein